MLGEEEIVNNFLHVVSLKHRLLRSPELQIGLWDTFLFQKTLMHDGIHDTSVALHRYIAMKLIGKRNKWRQEILKPPFPLLPPRGCVHTFLSTTPHVQDTLGKLAVPWLASAFLGLFHVAREEPAQNSALNKYPLCSTTALSIFQATCLSYSHWSY